MTKRASWPRTRQASQSIASRAPRRNPSSALDLLEVRPTVWIQQESQQMLENNRDIWRGMKGSPIVKVLAIFASGVPASLSDVAAAINAIAIDEHMTTDNEYMDMRGVATRSLLNQALQHLAQGQLHAQIRRSAVGR